MAIHIDPSKFERPQWHDFPSKVPKLAEKDYSQRELERIKKEPTEVNIDGDVYTASSVSFKQMSKDELRYEKIEIDSENDFYFDKESVIFLPYENGYIDDYKFISPIEKIEKFDKIYDDIYGYMLKTYLMSLVRKST